MDWRKRSKSIPAAVSRNIKFNLENERYEIEENGVKYSLTHGQLALFKRYIAEYRDYSIENWYDNLNRFEKKEVDKKGRGTEDESYSDGDFIE